MQLKPYEEIVGILSDVKQKENMTSLFFSSGKTIEISMRETPQTIIESKGKRIGILRTENAYKMRTITKEDKPDA